MSTATEYVIETQGLTKTYKGVQALKSLDLQVHQNSICGFLGPNGAGKTTTIKLLQGLARPTGGSGRVFGKDIQKESEEIRRRAGYLAQDSILGEKHSGTAAWVLSKPMKRPTFILAKLVALGLGLLVTGIVLPGVIAYFQLRADGLSRLLSALNWAKVTGLVYLNVLFYLTLALMLATIFHGRGPVLGISLLVQMSGMMGFSAELVLKHAPWLVAVLPWQPLTNVGDKQPIAGFLAIGLRPPTVTPINGTAVWCVLFTVVAIWRFRREEF